MITSQDIRDKVFEKAKFNNGYDMASVDEFLEELANEISAAQKENSVMKGKMKVLAAKIEEYRNNENAIQQILVSSQKLANQIETEARARAEKMIAEAQLKVDEKIGSIQQLAVEQEKRLADARIATKKFCEEARAICEAQMQKITNIENGVADAVEEAPAPKAAPAVKDIDDDIKLVDDTMKFDF